MAPDAGRGPRRTCVGCRTEADPDEMIRLVVGPDGDLCVDARGRFPGRGAWVHVRGACTSAARERPASLHRALHASPRAETLDALVRASVHAALGDGLSQAAAAGALVGGQDLLRRALASGECVEVVVAEGASPQTIAGLRAIAGADLAFTTVPFDVAALGARVGKGPRAALGVRRSRAATHLLRQLRRLRDLG